MTVPTSGYDADRTHGITGIPASSCYLNSYSLMTRFKLVHIESITCPATSYTLVHPVNEVHAIGTMSSVG